MSIGPDISEVFDELGTAITIHKPDGTEISEKVDMEFSIQASSPFLTQFILNGTFVYDSEVAPGDVLSDDDGTRYIVAALNPSRFENEIVVKECVLYRCNVLGDLKERHNVREGVHYNTDWVVVESDIYALLTGLPDDKILSSKDYGEFPSSEMTLHLSGNVDIQVKQRFELVSGEKVEIIGVEPRRLNNLTLCKVRTDERE